jgi:predicted chitinase
MKYRMRMAAAVAAMTMAGGCGLSNAQSDTITRSEFEQIFPGHSGFYSYDDFAATTSFGSRREAAAFLANVYHETGGLRIVDEDPGMRSVYCDSGRPYGCPAGRGAYFGRGPMQLSWNYNYKDAGDALGLDLLNNPDLVANDPSVAWRTAAWYWNTQVPHGDFGDTIDAINGAQECNGGNPGQVADRVSAYRRIADILGVSPGGNLSC